MVSVINWLPLSPIKMKSPYMSSLFEEYVKLLIKYFKVFGSIFYVHVSDELEAKAKNCSFMRKEMLRVHTSWNNNSKISLDLFW